MPTQQQLIDAVNALERAYKNMGRIQDALDKVHNDLMIADNRVKIPRIAYTASELQSTNNAIRQMRGKVKQYMQLLNKEANEGW